MSNIGLLNEKSLHASLKVWYAQPKDQFEVPVDGFVIDIVRDGLLLEIQTGNFSSIKLKLGELLRTHKVRLIYPIAREKWIIKRAKDNDSEETRRRSPKIGRVEDLFREMVRIPYLILNPNFSLKVLLINEEEERRYVGKGRWRRKGWAIEERRLLKVVDQRLFENASDYQALLPEKTRLPFTTKDLVDTMGIRIQLAQKMVYCLQRAGVIEFIGKQGRYKLYGIAGP